MDPVHTDVVHEERQGVPAWALGVSLLSALVVVAILVPLAVSAMKAGPGAGTTLIIVTVVVVLAEVAMFSFLTGLRTTVTREALVVRFGYFPVRLKLPIPDVEWCRALSYNPLRDFGGWGLKYGKGGTKAWTGRGNLALLVQMRDGRRYVIGSDDPETLAGAMRVAGAETRPMAESLQEGLGLEA